MYHRKARYSLSAWLALVMLFVLFFPAPADAQYKPLEWTTVDKPGLKNYVIVSPSEVSRIAVGNNGVVYAIDSANSKLYCSSNGGLSWSDITAALITAGITLPPTEIACSSSDPKNVAVVTADRHRVYFSDDSGTTWNIISDPVSPDPVISGPIEIQCIAFSPSYQKNKTTVYDIAIGTAQWHNDTTDGQLYICQTNGSAWKSQGIWVKPGVLQVEVSAIAFSPNYSRDSTLLVTASTANNVDPYSKKTWLCIGKRDLGSTVSTTNWNTDGHFSNYPVAISPTEGDPNVITGIISSIGLPSDYDGTDSTKRKTFVSYNIQPDTTANAGDGVFRLDDTMRVQIGTSTLDLSSISYYGTLTSGKLLAGEANPNSDPLFPYTVRVWHSSNPLDPTPSLQLASNPPSGPPYPAPPPPPSQRIVQVKWSTDGKVAYCGTGQLSANVLYDESAFSRSEDNGDTWIQTSLINTTIRATDIAIEPDSRSLFLATYSPSSAEAIWRTTAEPLGNFWGRVFSMQTNSNRLILRMSPNYPDDYTIYAIEAGGAQSNKLAVTHTRGNRWQHRLIPGPVADVAVADRETLYVGLADGGVRKSLNGGMMWQAPVPTGLDSINTLTLSTNGHIFAGSRDGKVAYSIDEGRSFTVISKPIGNVFPAGDTQVVTDATYIQNNNIYASNPNNPVYTGIWGTTDANNIFAVSSFGTILCTKDNSATWIPMASGTTKYLTGIWGTNASNILAVGNNGTILHYNDSTWNPVTSSTIDTTKALTSVWGWGSGVTTNVFAAGSSGTILRSTDNGSNWSPMTSNTLNYLAGIWGIDANNIFAAGNAGTILRSTDNGSNWSPMTSNTLNYLAGIWGTDANNLFAVGNNGTILHSINNGSNWSPVKPRPTPSALNSTWGWGSGTTTNIFAVGNNGTILRSLDNGTTWSPMPSSTVSDLTCIWGTPSNNIFVTGSSGIILRSTDNGATWTTIKRGSNSGVWRWTIGNSIEWQHIDKPLFDTAADENIDGLKVGKEGTLYALRSEPANGIDSNRVGGMNRSLNPVTLNPQQIEWDVINRTLPLGTSFNPLPLYTHTLPWLKISGNASENQLWSIHPKFNGLLYTDFEIYRFVDNICKAGPATKPTGDIGCDPVSGRSQEVNFLWEQLSVANAYEMKIAKDKDFTQIVHDSGIFYLEAPTLMSPAYIYFSNAYFTTTTTGTELFHLSGLNPCDCTAPGVCSRWNTNPQMPLECGHLYYWKVRVRNETSCETVRSPWSATKAFTIKAGFRVTTPYYGPQLLAPDNGCGCPCDAPLCFSWSPFKETSRYLFEVYDNSDLSNPLVSRNVNATAYQYTGRIACNKNYFWRVRASEPSPSEWSATFTFKTGAAAPQQRTPPAHTQTPLWVWGIIACGLALWICIFILVLRRKRQEEGH